MLLHPERPADLQRAVQLLADDGLLAFPTETVYGLGARADHDAAVARIFAAKGRPADHPLIVHVADTDAARTFAATWPASAQVLAQAFWPGPLTLIVPRRPHLATAAAGGQDSIGLRCPDHPAALVLLRAAAQAGVPGVAGPSANRFGRVSPTRSAHVLQEFDDEVAVLEGGACREGIESTIVDCSRDVPTLLRPGNLGRDAVAQVLEDRLGLSLRDRDEAAPRASGTLASHYAPRAWVHLAEPAQWADPQAVWWQGGAVAFYASKTAQAFLAHLPKGAVVQFRAHADEPKAVAHELFAVLREADDAGVAHIVIAPPPVTVAWEGVRDRLQRAATR